MNWSRASTSLLLVVAMSERLPGLRGSSLRPGVPDTEDIEATRGGPWGEKIFNFVPKLKKILPDDILKNVYPCLGRDALLSQEPAWGE